MLPNHLVRSLTNALTGLIVLVCLSLFLLVTSAFLYPDDVPVNNGWEGINTIVATSVKSAPLTEQQVLGKQLFDNNCAQCHAVTEEIVVGPGLKGITNRTPGEAWLVQWVRNSQAVVASGDPYAVQIYNKFQKIPMSSFTNLTDADIKAILAYVDAPPTVAP
ncbi:c-type cytochrome [Spirosoma arcticum]